MRNMYHTYGYSMWHLFGLNIDGLHRKMWQSTNCGHGRRLPSPSSHPHSSTRCHMFGFEKPWMVCICCSFAPRHPHSLNYCRTRIPTARIQSFSGRTQQIPAHYNHHIVTRLGSNLPLRCPLCDKELHIATRHVKERQTEHVKSRSTIGFRCENLAQRYVANCFRMDFRAMHGDTFSAIPQATGLISSFFFIFG